MAADKIKTCEELADIIEKEKAAGKTAGFTNGCFDILHLGHIKYLNDAKKECDILVIGVNSDGSVRRLKGDERPINPQQARLEVLAALESVDYITIFDEDTPLELIKSLTPDVLFKGGDWREEDIVGGDHVKASGGKVRVIPYLGGYSTTELIQRIKKMRSQ
ncbi:MAG: D-glycero-beta-D-manno-heptose 1-phosphate adenylyltransferase [Candidatus Omnitrophica bacterium]|nr:D-glycero-beta-D-manno-heptose 1-phosphate adenylyltransferase [Candidatus Omnitrophota bacterium]